MEYQSYRKTAQSVFSLGIFIARIFLAGCIDLATNESKHKPSGNKKPLSSKGQVYVMRGGLGGVFSKGMNRLQDRLENDYQITASSTVWYKAQELSDFIIKHYETKELQGPIILVGHSLGANDQIKVARSLAQANIPVALLMTIDAVSPKKVPPNVEEAFNIYKSSYVPLFSGLVLNAVDKNATHIENYNVTTVNSIHVNHFTIDMNDSIQTLMLNKVLAVLKVANAKHHIS